MKTKIDKLLIQLINLHPKYIDLSLDRIKALLNKLGNPHLNLSPTIHIAGTNGKGSTLSYLKHILNYNGYSVNAYISPHLSKFNERIVLNNKEVSTGKLLNCLKYVKSINQGKPITFFEITTAAAFLLFAKTKADFLILETGLGGRLDATNVIPKSLVSIITPISYDHEDFLGNSIKQITSEKLGIIKKNNYVIIGKQKSEIETFIRKKIKNIKHKFFFKKNYGINNISKKNLEFFFNKKKYLIEYPKLLGKHQIENTCMAVAGSLILKDMGYNIKLNLLNKGIINTKWPGRLEMINYKNKKILLDGSHNVDGAINLNSFLKDKNIKPWILFGMLNTKKIKEFLCIIQNQIEGIVAIKIPEEKNAFTANQILKKCKQLKINCVKKNSIREANNFLFQQSTKYILITGSLYLVGKLRGKYL